VVSTHSAAAVIVIYGIQIVAIANIAMPTVVVGQVIARDDAAWLRAQRVHLPPVAAAGRVRVGDLIGRDVVVATATGRDPSPTQWS